MLICFFRFIDNFYDNDENEYDSCEDDIGENYDIWDDDHNDKDGYDNDGVMMVTVEDNNAYDDHHMK